MSEYRQQRPQRSQRTSCHLWHKTELDNCFVENGWVNGRMDGEMRGREGDGLLPEAAANGWELPGESNSYRPLGRGQHFLLPGNEQVLSL